MVLEHSPALLSQLRAVAGLEHSPARNELDRIIADFLLACLVEGRTHRTVTTYRDRLMSFADFSVRAALPTSPTDIDSSQVRLWLLHLQQKKVKDSTSNACYRALHRFFRWAIAEGLLAADPMVNVKPPRIPKTWPQPFSPTDIRRLLVLCDGSRLVDRRNRSTRFVDLRNRAIILVFLDTGLRLSELAGVDLVDMDLQTGTIKVMGKGAKERVVRIGKITQQTVLRYLLARTDSHPCLWVAEERKPLSARGVQIMVKRMCGLAGITGAKCGPHTFRHTAAITFLRNGGGEFALQYMLGHSTLSMTRRYVSALGADDMIRVHEKASPVDNLGLR